MSKILKRLAEIKEVESGAEAVVRKAEVEAEKIEASAAATIATLRKEAADKIRAAASGSGATVKAAKTVNKEVDKKKMDEATAFVMKEFKKRYAS